MMCTCKPQPPTSPFCLGLVSQPPAVIESLSSRCLLHFGKWPKSRPGSSLHGTLALHVDMHDILELWGLRDSVS